MKKIFVAMLVSAGFLACNSNSSTETKTDSSAGNPAVTQPPSENIPDTMTIKNDSVIVPDSTR